MTNLNPLFIKFSTSETHVPDKWEKLSKVCLYPLHSALGYTFCHLNNTHNECIYKTNRFAIALLWTVVACTVGIPLILIGYASLKLSQSHKNACHRLVEILSTPKASPDTSVDLKDTFMENAHQHSFKDVDVSPKSKTTPETFAPKNDLRVETTTNGDEDTTPSQSNAPSTPVKNENKPKTPPSTPVSETSHPTSPFTPISDTKPAKAALKVLQNTPLSTTESHHDPLKPDPIAFKDTTPVKPNKPIITPSKKGVTSSPFMSPLKQLLPKVSLDEPTDTETTSTDSELDSNQVSPIKLAPTPLKTPHTAKKIRLETISEIARLNFSTPNKKETESSLQAEAPIPEKELTPFARLVETKNSILTDLKDKGEEYRRILEMINYQVDDLIELSNKPPEDLTEDNRLDQIEFCNSLIKNLLELPQEAMFQYLTLFFKHSEFSSMRALVWELNATALNSLIKKLGGLKDKTPLVNLMKERGNCNDTFFKTIVETFLAKFDHRSLIQVVNSIRENGPKELRKILQPRSDNSDLTPSLKKKSPPIEKLSKKKTFTEAEFKIVETLVQQTLETIYTLSKVTLDADSKTNFDELLGNLKLLIFKQRQEKIFDSLTSIFKSDVVQLHSIIWELTIRSFEMQIEYFAKQNDPVLLLNLLKELNRRDTELIETMFLAFNFKKEILSQHVNTAIKHCENFATIKTAYPLLNFAGLTEAYKLFYVSLPESDRKLAMIKDLFLYSWPEASVHEDSDQIKKLKSKTAQFIISLDIESLDLKNLPATFLNPKQKQHLAHLGCCKALQLIGNNALTQEDKVKRIEEILKTLGETANLSVSQIFCNELIDLTEDKDKPIVAKVTGNFKQILQN